MDDLADHVRSAAAGRSAHALSLQVGSAEPLSAVVAVLGPVVRSILGGMERVSER